MRRPNFPQKLLAVHILCVAGLVSLSAQATVITNSLSALATAKAGSNAPSTSPVDGNPQTDPLYVSQYAFSSDGTSSTGSSAWGNNNGVYRASADGSGKFDSTGHFSRALTILNDNGFATDYSISFFIYYGSISAASNGVSGTGYGSFDLNITRGSSTLFSSYAKVDSAGGLTQTGTALDGATLSGSDYSWNGTYVSFNLGTLADGASTTINFDLVSTAFGDFGSSTSESCYGGYGGYGGEFQALLVGDGYGGCSGSVYASLGDPTDFAENGFNNPFVVVTDRRTPSGDIPLPGTLALLGIGLAGAGLMRKRRQG